MILEFLARIVDTHCKLGMYDIEAYASFSACMEGGSLAHCTAYEFWETLTQGKGTSETY